jgi:hypothetical protein
LKTLRQRLDEWASHPARVRRELFALMAAAAFAVAAIAVVQAQSAALDEIAGESPTVLIRWTYMLVPAMFIFSRLLRSKAIAKAVVALAGGAFLCWLMLLPVMQEPAARANMNIALACAAVMGLITDLAVAAAQRWDWAFAAPYIALAVESWAGIYLWILWRYPERVDMIRFLWKLDVLVSVAVVAGVFFFLAGRK